MTSVQPAAEDRPCTTSATGALISEVAARVAELAQTVRELERLVDPGALTGGLPAQARARSGVAAEPEFELFARAANLTGREAEVLRHLLDGHSNRRISRTLHISESTVKNHLHAIFVKLDTRDRTQVIAKVYRFLAEHSAARGPASSQVGGTSPMPIQPGPSAEDATG